MSAGRFVIAGHTLTPGASVRLPDDVAHQVRDVLRLGVGDAVHILDGAGAVYSADVVRTDRKQVVVHLDALVWTEPEPACRVVLCQGVIRAARYETVLQKCTELGVSAFRPVVTSRSVARDEAGEEKFRRWQHIVSEATEQCGAARMPELHMPCALEQALAARPEGSLALIPWELERQVTIRDAMGRHPSPPAEVGLCIGSEGGFSRQEVQIAESAGAIPVTLGTRILRAETAAIVSTALVLAEVQRNG